MLYATSGTAAATAAKVATLASGTIALKAGVTVAVRFTYANTAASPTLNVNSTGAKAVYTQGVRYAYWSAGATVIFTYDGSYWRVASEPVYASTATIGNPGAANIFIEGNNIGFREGSNEFAALYSIADEDSRGAALTAYTDFLKFSGRSVSINAFEGSVKINCESSIASDTPFL